jgi:hypothetical protein
VGAALISLLFTLWIILVTVASLFLVGVPVACFLFRKDDFNSSFWLYVPLLGFCTIILIVQNAIYCNIPIRLSTPFVWIGIGIGWVWVWRYHRPIFSSLPLWVLLSALAAYVVQAYGLLIIGADVYLGRAWLDQYNYISLSQFLVELPYNVSAQDFANKMYLLIGYTFRSDRIGQSVFQGFITTSSFVDSRYTFEAVRLITPLLIAIGIGLFCYKLRIPTRTSAIIAFYAALLPGATLHHLEGFLSHALVSPLILVLPLLVQDFIDQPEWRSWLRLSLIITTAISVYTEFAPLLVVVVVGGVLAELIFKRRKLLVGVLACSTLCSFLLLNPLFTPSMIKILTRIDTQNVLAVMYPWAYSLEGLVHIWFGEYSPALGPILQYLLRGLALGFTVIAGYGWWRIWSSRRDSTTSGALAILGLTLALGVADRSHPYQFYKLLITVSPFLVLGIGIALWQWSSATTKDQSDQASWRSRYPFLPIGVLLTFMAAAIFGTVDMIRTTTSDSTPVATYGTLRTDRSRSALFLSSDMRSLEQKLLQLRGQNLLIVTDSSEEYGGYNSGFVNAWLTYFARNNRVWVTNFKYQTADLRNIPAAIPDIDYTALPDDLYILTDQVSSPIETHTEGLTSVWEVGAYRLSRVANRHWVVPLHGQDLGSSADADMTIGSKPISMTFISGSPRTLKLVGTFEDATVPPDHAPAFLSVTSGDGIQQDLLVQGSTETISVTIALGSTTITLQPTAPPATGNQPDAAAQAGMIQVHDLMWYTEVSPNGQAWIIRIDNPYGLETYDGESFFWLGEESANIQIVVEESGLLDVTAEFLLGPSIPNQPSSKLRIATDQGYQQDMIIESGKHTIQIPVRSGTTIVSITDLDKPLTSQIPNNDPRTLILGIKGIRLELHPQNQ